MVLSVRFALGPVRSFFSGCGQLSGNFGFYFRRFSFGRILVPLFPGFVFLFHCLVVLVSSVISPLF